MKFQITIDCNNAAFTQIGSSFVDEIKRILGNVTKKLEEGRRNEKIFDINGNTVGEFGFKNIITKRRQ